MKVCGMHAAVEVDQKQRESRPLSVSALHERAAHETLIES